MAVYIVQVAQDGTLTSSQTTFQPGDTIRFESGVPLYALVSSPVAIEVQAPLALGELSGQAVSGAVLLRPHKAAIHFHIIVQPTTPGN